MTLENGKGKITAAAARDIATRQHIKKKDKFIDDLNKQISLHAEQGLFKTEREILPSLEDDVEEILEHFKERGFNGFFAKDIVRISWR